MLYIKRLTYQRVTNNVGVFIYYEDLIFWNLVVWFGFKPNRLDEMRWLSESKDSLCPPYHVHTKDEN